MPYRLLKYGLWGKKGRRMWRWPELRPSASYDAVIVGGGVHGLGCAYYLAKEHGLTRVAVLERGYIGGGGSGRNTAIIRSNYLSPEGTRFYDDSVKRYEQLSQELDFNLMFSQRGHLTLAHTDGSLAMMRQRAETNQLHGIRSYVLDPQQIAELAPFLDTRPDVRLPIVGGLFHEPGGIIRHDAVVWAYASAADHLGVDIFQDTPCTGILTEAGRVVGVRTPKGDLHTGRVHNATAGHCSVVSEMAGVRLPVTTHPLQACVTEPLKPFLDTIVGSAEMHVYLSQADRGELVMGGSVDPYESYTTRSTLDFLEGICGYVLELFPSLHHVRVLRQWTGLCDMTPDNCPIIGPTPVEGFTLDVGWGTYGFKAGPAAAAASAELIAAGRLNDLVAPFGLSRFARGSLLLEDKGATH